MKRMLKALADPPVATNAPVADEVKHTTCYMCACRCGIKVSLRDGTIRYIEGNRRHPVNRGVLCAKGSAGIMQHCSPARLSKPLLRTGPRGSGEFREIEWDEAIGIAVRWLSAIRSSNPNKLALFTGRDPSQALTGWWAMQFGTANYAAHGGFCSVNMAAGGLYTIGGSFWEFGEPDWDHTKYFMWRAFSQWRSSWLSREGVAAVITYVPSVSFGIGWILFRRSSELWPTLGFLTCVGAIATVGCTGYIYRSLKPIPAWCNGLVVPSYLSLSAMTGVLWLAALSNVFGYQLRWLDNVVILTISLALLLKLSYWRFIDGSHSNSTPESATGLGSLGKIRLLEAPHTSENYLLKEMGFRIARKHSQKLRMISVCLGFALPFALVLTTCFASGVFVPICWLLAASTAMIGVLVERWLFFAEAKHTVTLYYGRELGRS